MIKLSTRPSRLMRGTALLLLTGALLSACGALGPGPSPKLYVLSPGFAPVAAASVNWRLQIADPEASDGIDTVRIALINPPNQLDYYANAAFPDRLSNLVQNALVEGFERSGKIASVAPDSAAIRADYILQTNIRDFAAIYDIPDAAPRVKVRIMAKLVRANGRDIIQSMETTQDKQAADNSIDSVITAANQALGTIITQIVDWSLRAPAPVKP